MVLALEAQGMARPMVQHLSETKLAAMLAQVTSVATTPDRDLTTGSAIGIADLTTGSAIGIMSNHFDIRASTFVITASTTRFPLGAQGVQAVPPGRLSTPIRLFFCGRPGCHGRGTARRTHGSQPRATACQSRL